MSMPQYKYRNHTEGPNGKKCCANDLFLVSEGLQCGNCLVLIQEYIPEWERGETGKQEEDERIK